MRSTTESEGLDLSKLKPYEKRTFVPDNAVLTDQTEVVALLEKLLKRDIQSAKELEQWLKDRSEFDAALDQAGSELYIRMTCQTDDPSRAKAYKDFIEHVAPAIKPLNDQLNQKYLRDDARFSLGSYYEVYNRSLKTDVELFREENVPLQTEVDLLSQEYQTICGAMTVHFQGKDHTMPQMSKYLLENDRRLRESAWTATSERRLQEKEKLDDLFNKMLKIRHRIALNAGFSNFAEYQFKNYHRFDYSSKECKIFHDSVERLIVPILESIHLKRKNEMKLKSLKPWDLSVDPLGRKPLKPFEDVKTLNEGARKMFNQLDPELGKQFEEMLDMNLLDLESRKGKAPGGYQQTLAEIRKPFIFMNAVGVDQDIWTLLHEGGHAFHAFAASSQFLYNYRHAPMEYCEVASMAMELLAAEHIRVFYDEKDTQRSLVDHLEDIVQTLVWVATIDAFQFWIYENSKQTSSERVEAWLKIKKRFGGDLVDWQGLDEAHAFMWHRQLHIFEVPFYYIEYGIAQLGALQLWRTAKMDPKKALANYRSGLRVGGSKPLPEIFKASGIVFDFSEKTIAPLMKIVEDELGYSKNPA